MNNQTAYQSLTGKMIVDEMGTVNIGISADIGYTQWYELNPLTSDLIYLEGPRPDLDKLAITYRNR